MKLVILSIIISLSLSVFGQQAVELKSRPLDKDIKKRFGIIKYQRHAITIDSNLHSMGDYYQLSTNDSLFGYLYIGRVNSCRTGGCSSERTDINDGSYEYFDYFVLFNTKKELVNIRVFNYQATHGQEITAQSWLKQFRGYSGQSELNVGKDIDAISGATISAYAITVDIEYITSILKSISIAI